MSSSNTVRRWVLCLAVTALSWPWSADACAQSRPLSVNAGTDDVDLEQHPIDLSAQFLTHWSEEGTDHYVLRGQCRITQGPKKLASRQAVVWISESGGLDHIRVYVEDEAVHESPQGVERISSGYFDLQTRSGVRIHGRDPHELTEAPAEPLVQRAVAERDAAERRRLQQTQLIVPPPGGAPVRPVVPRVESAVERHVSINPRYLGQQFSFNTKVTDSVPPELVITVPGGVNIVVTNVLVVINGVAQLTTVDLTADSAVIWTDPKVGELGSEFDISPDTPLQVYLEGNIIVRQGMNEVRATHAFYDVGERRGLLMNAEVRAFVPELETFLRLRARQVRQLSETNFYAQDAWVSTSQMGRPGYRVEASEIFLEERPNPASSGFDPNTGQPLGGDLWVTSLNNRLFIGEVPVFAAPYLSAPAAEPQVPLRNLQIGYDGIFGLKVESAWSLEGLLGVELPKGADWDLEADIFSDRGPGIGTTWDVQTLQGPFGLPTISLGRFYYLNDGGRDNVGLGRRSLNVPDNNRGRALIRHRMELNPFGTTLTGELGYLSDRNFLEQYYENEWDQDKDHESLVSLNHQVDNFTVSGLVQGRLNDFSYTTEWLPRVDLSILSEPVLGSPLTWSSHSSVGYGRIRPAQAPSDPNDTFQALPWQPSVDGTVAMTRHQLDLPFNVGPVKVVPYVLGEAAYWDEDLTGAEDSRLYGSAGVRGSVLFWTVNPELRSSIFGLNGLAHKMVFDWDYSYSESDKPLSTVAPYNAFDDNAQERFRTRYVPLEFGGVLPPMFDPRFYALRSGAGRGVTAPYHELVDDLHVLRMGWRHRWQTKVGPPARPRIEDWMTLDLEASWFPDENRDNFGEDFGLIGGRYNWYVGERTTLLADALYDLFDGGQELWSVGILTQRSARGSLYLGFRQVKVGPIDSQLLAASYSYVMGPKWVSTFGTSYDIAEGLDRGQSFTITRVGEYALLHFGFGYDRSRNNVGVAISLEPRLGGFGAGSTQLSSLLGIH